MLRIFFVLSLVVSGGCVWIENTRLQRSLGAVCFLGCQTRLLAFKLHCVQELHRGMAHVIKRELDARI